MNLKQASEIVDQFLELEQHIAAELNKRRPKYSEYTDLRGELVHRYYSLDTIEVSYGGAVAANWSIYLGCGEHETHRTTHDLVQFFSEEPT